MFLHLNWISLKSNTIFTIGKIKTFLFLNINGYYKSIIEDFSWHKHEAFWEPQLSRGNILLLGRKTYEMMSNFWLIKMAEEAFPVVAKNRYTSFKFVLSNSLKKVTWQNTSIIKNDVIEEIKK